MSRCAVRMFDQGRFKVKVIVKGQTHYRVRFTSLEPLVFFYQELCTNVKYDESMCSAYD